MSTGAPPARAWSPAFLDQFDTLLFDCDGVLWHEASPIPGAIATLQHLHAVGKRLLFATNNSGKSRADYATKFTELGFTGFPLAQDQIFTSSQATAHFIAGLPKEQFDPQTQKVFTVGESGIALELREKGIDCIEARDKFGSKHLPRSELSKLEIDPSIGCVVVGIDDQMTYTKTAYAAACLRQTNTGTTGSSPSSPSHRCLFISTNQDSTLPTGGHTLPGAGSCVSFIATASGRQPVNIGKPETHMLELACDQFKLDRKRMLMIGDRLDTDILFGLNGGVQTLFVSETGINRREDIERTGIRPTFITTDISKMVDLPKASSS